MRKTHFTAGLGNTRSCSLLRPNPGFGPRPIKSPRPVGSANVAGDDNANHILRLPCQVVWVLLFAYVPVCNAIMKALSAAERAADEAKRANARSSLP